MEYLVTMTTRVPAGAPEPSRTSGPGRPPAPANSPRGGTSCGRGVRRCSRPQQAKEPAGQATGR